ncbi:hypothetical protein GWI68_09495 [Proteus sp. G2669]|nr:hypothetical protein [Proteus sp. G2669]
MGALIDFIFSLIRPVGILGYILIISRIGALVNDNLVEKH